MLSRCNPPRPRRRKHSRSKISLRYRGPHSRLDERRPRMALTVSLSHSETLWIKQTDIPAHESVAKKNPDQRANRQIRTERKFRRPNSLAQYQCEQTDQRAEDRAGKNAEQNRAPTRESPDRSKEFQIAAPHRRPRYLQCSRHSENLIHLIQQNFFTPGCDPVVVKFQSDFAELAIVDLRLVAMQQQPIFFAGEIFAP